MKSIKYIFAVLFLVAVSCMSVEHLPDEPFGIYSVQERKTSCYNDNYRQVYRLYMTPNVSYYTVAYYYPTEEGWQQVGSESHTISDQAKRKAEQNIGIMEGFDVNQKIPVKIEVIAYRYKDSDFTKTESISYTFNIHKSEVICQQ